MEHGIKSPLGAHIPLIYHFAMLQDRARMEGFREAISKVVKPGATVLELGGGTGVLSYYAAQSASKVYCVEQIPENVDTAREILRNNSGGDRVEVICGDAFDYLPPTPVDVVICEMLHVAQVRERQLDVIESFKRRYLEKFGGPLPRFIPEAYIQAIQPLYYNYDFFGYKAAVPVFQPASNAVSDGSKELGDPVIYQVAEYSKPLPLQITWQGKIKVNQGGEFNSLRFILKNLLAIVIEENRSVDWHNHYLIMPLPKAISVQAGESIDLTLNYRAGCEMIEFKEGIGVSKEEQYIPLSSQVERLAGRKVEPFSDRQVNYQPVSIDPSGASQPPPSLQQLSRTKG